jgi:hypothetical protein
MQPGDSQTLVGSFLRQYHKSLTLQQMSVLLAKEDSGSPLYLITACSSLLNFGIYEEMDKELDKLPTRKIPLLSAMIQSLRELFGAEVVRSTLLLVYFSQGGIFEHELQHLVNKEVERIGVDVAKNGDFSFSLLYQRLQSLLPTNSSGLLHFFHNDMRTLIFEEFLGLDTAAPPPRLRQMAAYPDPPPVLRRVLSLHSEFSSVFIFKLPQEVSSSASTDSEFWPAICSRYPGCSLRSKGLSVGSENRGGSFLTTSFQGDVHLVPAKF